MLWQVLDNNSVFLGNDRNFIILGEDSKNGQLWGPSSIRFNIDRNFIILGEDSKNGQFRSLLRFDSILSILIYCYVDGRCFHNSQIIFFLYKDLVIKLVIIVEWWWRLMNICIFFNWFTLCYGMHFTIFFISYS